MFLFLLLAFLPAGAGGIDDADERLYQAQLALAQKGDPRAQYFLGEMYEQGLGTEQNTEEALKWYATAAERGDVLAKRKLSMRKEIEADVKTDKSPAAAAPPPPPPPPAVKVKSRPTPTHTAKTSDTPADEEATRQLAIKAAEREKRRAAVRAMILERIRHPSGEPFE